MNHFFKIEPSDSDLQHHGILGQKWGVRRFQKIGGGLTPEGKKRYEAAIKASKSGSELASSGKEIIKNASRFKKNDIDINNMSNQDLQALVNRMNLERQYTTLKESERTKGQDFADKVLSVGGSVLAATGSALSIALAIKQLRNK